MKIQLVIGTRPQIIKSAPIIHAARGKRSIDLQVIHTGQHYDYEMSRIFFNELHLPDPVSNLNIGSGTHAWQTGNMLMELEKIFMKHEPDMVLVPGDTNSTLAAALASAKLNIPLAHIESGARSHAMIMPEEVNRRLTDHCSQYLFTVSQNCKENLLNEGIAEEIIILSGDTMYDSIVNHSRDVLSDDILDKLDLTSESYSVITVHRPENVDNPSRLNSIIKAIIDMEDTQFIFPCHPRTKKQLQDTGLYNTISNASNVRLIDPVGYYSMLKLMKHANIVFTDSGGMQKEAFWLGTPCITLRDNTEWVETVQIGANILTGADTTLIKQAKDRYMNADIRREISTAKNPYSQGNAAEMILSSLIPS